MKKIVFGAIAVVVVAVAAVIIYFVATKEDEKPALSVTDRPANTQVLAGSTDGTWSLTGASVVRYKATESFVGGLADQAVSGETNNITGSVTVAGATVTQRDPFTVDMASITTGNGRRDAQYNGRIMQTDRFPTATFELDAPLTLPTVPADGAELTVSAPGTLTVRGVSKPVTVDLKAKLNGAELDVSASIPVTWSDYEIEDPSLGGFVSVLDRGSIELLLVFEKA